MTEQVYLKDSYMKELDTEVKSVGKNKVILNETIFYATGGGQPNDTGVLIKDDKKFKVIDVKKEDGTIVHYLEASSNSR